MSKLASVAKKFIREEEGASLVEYGLLVGLIAVACIAAIGILGGTISGFFNNINNELSTAGGGGGGGTP